MNEFDLIEQFFVQPKKRNDVVLGIGDDAAVCTTPDDHELVLTTDLLVAGIHFPEDTPAHAIGYKALAVNLSDLAAMGATPAWFTMTLCLPEARDPWLQEFSKGLLSLADACGITLVGGDTVEGPMSIGIQACGFVPAGTAVLRSGANAGDLIFVTGHLGDAALGLIGKIKKLDFNPEYQRYFSQRLDYPTPRVQEGFAVRDIASAMIDVSDGLVADLGHVLDSSGTGASVRLAAVPISDSYRDIFDDVGWDPALSGGDDYELCFTVSPDHVGRLKDMAADWDCGIAEIGRVEKETGLRVYDQEHHLYQVPRSGYEHFSG
ncbi:MAG: thiamine-phosphate kinase [Acidiferrobacterales bacterium]